MTTNDPVGVDWQNLSRAELDLQLSPSKSAKDALGTLHRHERETAALEANPGVEVYRNLPYGAEPRQCVDVYRPSTAKKPSCVAFVHGGFWQEGSKAGAGFAAAALAERGWALAAIGYTLTPTVRVRDIVAEVADAIVMLRYRLGVLGIDPSGLVLAGHSAGAHLASAIVAGLGGIEAVEAVDSAILISGVYDLAPIAASYVNDVAQLDAAEVADLSTLFLSPERDLPVRLMIGSDEPQAFQAQTDAVYAAWKRSITNLTLERMPGRDHFDVLDDLAPQIK